jgi:hypothetical protein
MNIRFMFQCLMTVNLSISLGCAPHVSKAGVEEQNGKGIAMRQEHQKQAKDTWLGKCRNQLSYIDKYKDAIPMLDWSIKKKEEITKLALRKLLETDQEGVGLGINEDNGKLPVNITVGSVTAPQNGFLLSDGEVETIVEWENKGKKEKKRIKSWTGSKEGVEKELENDEGVCLLEYHLKSWGIVQGKDTVVVTADMNEGSDCLQYVDGQWKFEGWSSYGAEPVYSIIMWEEDGEWKSTVRSKILEPLTIYEICQALGEEWGVFPKTATTSFPE